MATDANLIEGAYRAAAAGALGDTSVSRGITNMVKRLEDFGKAKQGQGENYMALANQVLNEGGELSADEYDALYDELQKGRLDYMWGNKKEKARAIRDLNMKQKDMTDFKEVKQYIAELTSSNMLRSDFEDSLEGSYILDLMKDESSLITYECPPDRPNCAKKGRKGIMMPDSQAVSSAQLNLLEYNELMNTTLTNALNDPNLQRDENNNPILSSELQNTLDGIDDMIMEQQSIIDNNGMRFVGVNEIYDMIKTKDSKFQSKLDAHLFEQLNSSAKLDYDSDIPFNRDLNEEVIRRFIIRGGDIMSMVYDDYNGRSFYEDFVENLTGTSYGELGIEEGDLIEYAKQFNIKGVNVEDGIDSREKRIIEKSHKSREAKMQHQKQSAIDYANNNLGLNLDINKGLTPQEAKIIADTIIKDKNYADQLEDEVVNYFVNMSEKQWNIGSTSRTKREKEENDDGSIDYIPE